MPKLMRVIWEGVKDELVDEALEAQMISTLERHKLATVSWLPRTHHSPYQLPTPYGVLDVCAYFRGCWRVKRNSHPLVPGGGRFPAVFTSVAAAKSAGLLHLTDGFGASAPVNDGLQWKISLHAPKSATLQDARDLAVDLQLLDDHEWGRARLDSLLEEYPGTGAAADVNLLLDISCVAQWWRLPPPRWTRVAQGFYCLGTPYGALSVRRTIGWRVERNGLPLVWWCSGSKVIFDKLGDAKTSALVHIADEGTNIRYRDGTRWDEPTDDTDACSDSDLSANDVAPL
jgi:hypothetical protein